MQFGQESVAGSGHGTDRFDFGCYHSHVGGLMLQMLLSSAADDKRIVDFARRQGLHGVSLVPPSPVEESAA
jgi:hypothetical protein